MLALFSRLGTIFGKNKKVSLAVSILIGAAAAAFGIDPDLLETIGNILTQAGQQ